MPSADSPAKRVDAVLPSSLHEALEAFGGSMLVLCKWGLDGVFACLSLRDVSLTLLYSCLS